MGNNPIFPTTKGILRKLGGDKISGKKYTFNGDTTGLETAYYNGIQFVMLADEYFDPNTIEHITVSVSGSVVELSKDQFWIKEESDAIGTVYVVLTEFQGSTVPIALIQKSNDGSQKIFGVLADPNYNAFVARIKFAETIVPISKDYLGGVCLPVVELETAIEFGELTEIVLSAADAAKMDALNGHPCILKFVFPFLGAASTIRAVAGSFGIATSFSYQVATLYGNFDFTNIDTADGAWVCAKV